jgi:hypothetical protein
MASESHDIFDHLGTFLPPGISINITFPTELWFRFTQQISTMNFLEFFLLLFGLFSSHGQAAAPYELRPPPLDTPWTEKVGTNPWPQYPRPQLRRDAWQSLNGIWTYQPAQGAAAVANPPALPLEKETLIPSCIESGISGIMDMSFSVTHMWFGTNFTVPQRWAESGRRVLLNFEAVDYEATVYVNGAEVGFNRGGYSRFTLDITENIISDKANELYVFLNIEL